jgi:DNA transformation protein
MSESPQQPPTPEASFSELPGRGPKSSAMLLAAGVTSVSALRRMGSVAAFLRVREAGHRPSLNLLWTLEGALTGTSWVAVARRERTRLLFEWDDATSRQRVTSPRGVGRAGGQGRQGKPSVARKGPVG